jgi:cysteine-rich repeat protein
MNEACSDCSRSVFKGRPSALLVTGLLLLSCKDLEEYTEPDSQEDTGHGDASPADSLDSADAPEGSGCTTDGECTDSDPCNGEETCSLTTHTCETGTPREDGFVCGADPRSICLDEECVESVCGDGYVDTGGGESCEPPGEGSCTDECVLSCEGDLDCLDDGNPCNGGEYCELSVHECDHRDPLANGTVCGTSPRRICLSGSCQYSICGDGYVDGGASPPEECDDLNTVEEDGCDNDCTYSCHSDSECDDGHDCTGDACDTISTHTCSNFLLSSSSICRASAGYCDVSESCTGTDPDCPPDSLRSPLFVCRAAVDECDVEELCTGTSTSCPMNAFAAPGTPCDDGDTSTHTDQCDGYGTCAGIPIVTSEVFSFPSSGDTRVGASSGTYFWRAGDYVEGTRTSVLSTITSADVHLVITYNGLTCDSQDVDVIIDSVTVGSFMIVTGDTVIDYPCSFSSISGPTYTIRYETSHTVSSGCGAAGYANDAGSTITLHY